jgi:hypothetical protein
MAKDSKTQKPSGTQPNDRLIQKFLSGFEELTNVCGLSVQRTVSDADTRALAEHFTSVLNKQVAQLSAFVLQSYEQASPTKRSEVDQLVERYAAVELVSGTAAIADNTTSLRGFKGLSDIILLIKKIIRFILNLIFKGQIPGWINDLIDLIDEIIGTLLGLFNFRLQREINQTEIDFLKAMFHLKRLNAVEQSSTAFDEND